MSAVGIENWTPEYYIANQPCCQKILENYDILRQLPLLNDTQLHDIRDKQLVRFHGMVQDMYEHESYFKQYEVGDTRTGESDIRNGMYTDAAHCSAHEQILLESKRNETSDRRVFIMISVPGLNGWAKEKGPELQQFDMDATHNNNADKRNMSDDDSETMDCSVTSTGSKKKKILVDDAVLNMDGGHCSTKIQDIVSEDDILNFPIPINGGRACIVKIYDETTVKLNNVIDVIGFISLDPTLSTYNTSVFEMKETEMYVHNPPASLVPRLHAVKIIKPTKFDIVNAPEIVSKAELIRNDLYTILSQLSFGDNLAADYLICHLLSTIYTRKDNFCLGAFPLNITNFPASKLTIFPRKFYNFLTLFVKKSHFMEVTLKNLNELVFAPKKNYDHNRLISGILQLSDNTHLVIDETGLTTGELTRFGKLNYKALSDLLMFQTVAYDFTYYEIEFEADIPILIFSNVKSFIPCPVQVVLNVDAESENLYEQIHEAALHCLENESRLGNIRQYLEILRHTECSLNEEITKIIQEDFVQMRSVSRDISADNLHTLIILAKLISISYGKTTLDIMCWKKAVQLEMERMNRLSRNG